MTLQLRGCSNIVMKNTIISYRANLRTEKEKKNLQQIIEAEQLPPEPERGIMLGVVLPNQRMICRKFTQNEKGDNVCIRAVSQELLLSDPTYLHVDLIQAFNVPKGIDPGRAGSEWENSLYHSRQRMLQQT